MKVDELIVQVPFMRVRRGLEVGFQQPGVAGGPIGPPTPLALCLARAQVLDRTLEACGPGSLGILAERLGISPQRLAQIHAWSTWHRTFKRQSFCPRRRPAG